MRKIIIKAEDAEVGKIKGTGAGYVFASFEASAFSRVFTLKDGNFDKRYEIVNAKAGDAVVFAYL